MLRPDQWQLVATIGGGHTVAAVLDARGLAEFDGCRAVKELVDLRLVQVMAPARYVRRRRPGAASRSRPGPVATVAEHEPHDEARTPALTGQGALRTPSLAPRLATRPTREADTPEPRTRILAPEELGAAPARGGRTCPKSGTTRPATSSEVSDAPDGADGPRRPSPSPMWSCAGPGQPGPAAQVPRLRPQLASLRPGGAPTGGRDAPDGRPRRRCRPRRPDGAPWPDRSRLTMAVLDFLYAGNASSA